MPHPPPWKVLDRALLEDCRVFRVSRTTAESPRTGDAHDFFRLDAPDWVNIVPVTAEGDIVMVRQYRHGSEDVTLEIPGGMVDAGETPVDAATRELLEETGYHAPRARAIGVVSPNPALFGNTLHTFLAEGVEVEGVVQNDTTEETDVVLVPHADLGERLARGDISSALVVAALHWYHLAGAGA